MRKASTVCVALTKMSNCKNDRSSDSNNLNPITTSSTVFTTNPMLHSNSIGKAKEPPLRVIAVNTLLFALISALALTFFVIFDITLATAFTGGATQSSKWETKWWALPPLQLIFYITVIASCCKLVLSFGTKNQAKVNVLLALLTVLSGVIVLAIPETYIRQLHPIKQSVSRGNCTSFRSIEKSGGFLCPYYMANPHFFQLRPSYLLQPQHGEHNGNLKQQRQKNIIDAFLFLQKAIYFYRIY